MCVPLVSVELFVCGIADLSCIVLGDKESKKKQKSPASTGAAPQVGLRELKWDHQVSTRTVCLFFIVSVNVLPENLQNAGFVQSLLILEKVCKFVNSFFRPGKSMGSQDKVL